MNAICNNSFTDSLKSGHTEKKLAAREIGCTAHLSQRFSTSRNKVRGMDLGPAPPKFCEGMWHKTHCLFLEGRV